MTKSRNLIRKRWYPTEEQKQLVRAKFPDVKTQTIADELGVAYNQVAKLAKALGIKKSETFFDGEVSGRLDGIKGSNSRFKKGQTPINKGVKRPGTGSITSFKKGRKPQEAHNYVPIGTEKLRSDGYLVRKFTDDQTLVTVRRWEAVHRLVWIAANGPIPAGHVVAFKPGMHTTVSEQITLDKLELVSKREWIQRHTFHQYGPDIAGVVMLRSQLTRQINKIEKEKSK